MTLFCRKRLPNFNNLLLFAIFIAGRNYSSQANTQNSCNQDLHKHCNEWANDPFCPKFVQQCNKTCNHSSDTGSQKWPFCPNLAKRQWCRFKQSCPNYCNLSCRADTSASTQTPIAATTMVPTTTKATTKEAVASELIQPTTTKTALTVTTQAARTKAITNTANAVTSIIEPTTTAVVPVPTTQTTAPPPPPTTTTTTTAQSAVAAEATTTMATKTTTAAATVKAPVTTVQRAIAEIKALNITEKGSLVNAVDAINKLFRALEKKPIRMCWSNVFAATQQLETFAIEYTKVHFEANENRIILTEYFVMIIKKVPAGSKAGVFCSFNETENSAKKGRNSISIPPQTFHGQDAVVVCIIYKNVERCTKEDEQTQLHNNNEALNLKLGSRIIGASVYPATPGTLEENVTISLTQDDEFKKEDIPHCRFWDNSTLNGSWASRGCSLIKSINNEITCTCNHLTNFAVLMQVSASKGVSSKHSLALEVITHIGCALSLAGEVLTIIAYCVFMNLQQEKIQIRLNLVVAIAIAQVVFLSGINTSESKDVCVFVAALIHFFYLAGFAWMLFEGVYLYLMVVKVFNTAVRMRVFHAVAWGVPAVIVALSIVIASSGDGGVHSYVHGDLCWVSFNNNLIWTFVAPVLLVCLANSVFLGLVLREIVKMQNHNSEMKKLRQGTKAFVVLFPLLGMTWVFGVLSVTDAGLVFQYIFTILNSLQGFFIFILHVVRNEDMRAEFKRKKRMWKDARSINASLCSPQDQANTWTNKVVKSNAHELESRANEPAPWAYASTGNCITPVGM